MVGLVGMEVKLRTMMSFKKMKMKLKQGLWKETKKV